MQRNYTALAIVIGFGLVAGAIYVSDINVAAVAGIQGNTIESPRRSNTQHAFVYGAENARITIVEFSDFECPFCSRLHPTLKRIVDESGGKINWEYRHFPLPSHENAEQAAAIGECVGRLAGNDAFWEYSQTVFDNQSRLSEQYLSDVATSLGVSADALDSCVVDADINEQIATDLRVGRAFGGSGTPFSVVVYPDGTTQPISGALPYDNWKPLLSL